MLRPAPGLATELSGLDALSDDSAAEVLLVERMH
jgi:hypothetical protein